MYMYLLLWCFFIVKNVEMRFLFGVNACVFITVMLFFMLKWCIFFGVNVYVFITMVLFYC